MPLALCWRHFFAPSFSLSKAEEVAARAEKSRASLQLVGRMCELIVHGLPTSCKLILP